MKQLQPNICTRLSAGSGHNAFSRDEEQGAVFYRHKDKLCLCTDRFGIFSEGEKCSSTQQTALVRKPATEASIRKKIFSTNAQKIIRF